MSNALTLDQVTAILANLEQYKNTTVGKTGKPYNNVSASLLKKADSQDAIVDFEAACEAMRNAGKYELQVGDNTVYLNHIHFERVTDTTSGEISTKVLMFNEIQDWYNLKRKTIADFKFNQANSIANSPALEADMQVVRDRAAAISTRYEIRYVPTASIVSKQAKETADLPF